MNINKDILLAIGIVGLGGVMLYQVLFNFLLPIALFVVLLYILKLLIKGFDTSEEEEEEETTELLRDKSNSSTAKDLEEINPNKKENIEENKSVEIKPVIEINSVQKEVEEKAGKEE